MEKQKHEGTFWGRVDQIMASQHFTFTTLANDLGIGYRRIIMQRHRSNLPSLTDALLIARVLGVSVEYLVTGEHPDKDSNVIPFRKFADIETDLLAIDKTCPDQIRFVRSLIDVILNRPEANQSQTGKVLEFPVSRKTHTGND